MILEDGKILNKKVSCNLHFLIFEGDFVSDLTYDENGINFLRLREATDLQDWDEEDFFIKREDLLK